MPTLRDVVDDELRRITHLKSVVKNVGGQLERDTKHLNKLVADKERGLSCADPEQIEKQIAVFQAKVTVDKLALTEARAETQRSSGPAKGGRDTGGCEERGRDHCQGSRPRAAAARSRDGLHPRTVRPIVNRPAGPRSSLNGKGRPRRCCRIPRP